MGDAGGQRWLGPLGSGREKRIQVTSSSRSCSPLSPPFFSYTSSSAATASRRPRRMPEEGSQSFCLSACAATYARRSGAALTEAAAAAPAASLPTPGSPRSRGDRRAGVGSGLGARPLPGGGCAQARRPRGLRAGPGAGAGAAARSAAAAAAAAGAGAAAARGPACSLLARSAPGTVCFSCGEAGFGAQRGRRSQSQARVGGERRVGEAGRPRPGTRRCSSGGGSRAAALGPGAGVLRGRCVHPSIRRPSAPAVAPA